MMLSDHVDEEILEAYALGRIADRESAGLEEHLLLCPLCQGRLEQTDQFVRAFQVAMRGRPAPVPRQRQTPVSRWLSKFAPLWKPAPMAAVVVVAVVGLVALAPRSSLVESAAPADLRLEALRGAVSVFPANRGANLELDAKALDGVAYRVELTNAGGRRLWQSTGAVPVENGSIRANISNALPAGRYWVRLYDPASGELAREFGFQAR